MYVLTPGGDRFKPTALLKKGRHHLVTLVQETTTGKPRVARMLSLPPGQDEGTLLEGINRLQNQLNQFHHPNLPRFDKVVEGDGGTWMLFEYEPGTALSQYLQIETSVPTAWILWWLNGVLEALNCLHKQTPPMVVGYIEPGDVVVRGDRVFLVDLGLLEDIFPDLGIQSGLGFAQFVAPEKRQAPQAAPSADLFSAGAIAFWLITGHSPMVTAPQAGPRMREALGKFRKDLPAPAADLVASLLAFYPNQRPSSAEQALRHLAPFLTDLRGKQPPDALENVDVKVVAETTRPIKPPPPICEEAEIATGDLPVTVFVRMPEEAYPRRKRAWDRPRWLLPVLAGLGVVAVGWLGLLNLPHGHAAPIEVVAGLLQAQASTAGGPWTSVREVGPGEFVGVAGAAPATVAFDRSKLTLSAAATLWSLAWDGSRWSIQPMGGELRAQTGWGDILEVHIPSGKILTISGSSDVTVHLSLGSNDPNNWVLNQSGKAILRDARGSQPLAVGTQTPL